jgi:hypothetical protein
LRESIANALAQPRKDETALMRRISAALSAGADVEGVYVGVESLSRMIDVLGTLPSHIPLPEIVVESSCAIGLDWSQGRRQVLTLTVDDTPYVGFAALFGHEPIHGRVPFAGSLPKTLAYLFERLYPTESRTP